MKESFWKQNSYWWVPIAVVLLTGIGWGIKEYFSRSTLPGAVFGKLEGCPGETSILIDGKEAAKTSKFCYYRVEEVSPGSHEIQWQFKGYETKFSEVEVKGGTENRIDLTALTLLKNADSKAKTREKLTVDTNFNSWYAGTRFNGKVDMPEYGFVWNCSGGTCVLNGPFGKGLNMDVCQELSRRVGGLEYYYNDAGMKWTKTENAALLKQCNSAQESVSTDSDGRSTLLADKPDLNDILYTLSQPVSSCLLQKDTDHPAFNGCVDWHSSVHAVWALIRYRMVTGDKRYDQLIAAKLSKDSIRGEFQMLRESPYFEMPYGRAWFLRLVIDFEREFVSDSLREMGDYIAVTLIDHYSSVQINPYNQNYDNPSWALLNLYQYAIHRKNPIWSAFVKDTVSANFIAGNKKCETEQSGVSLGFMDVCGNWAYLVGETGATDDYNEWLQAFYSQTKPASPITAPRDTFEKGLNFSRAWSSWFIFEKSGDEFFYNHYLAHIETMFANPSWWTGDDYSVTHWIAQFGIYAVTPNYIREKRR